MVSTRSSSVQPSLQPPSTVPSSQPQTDSQFTTAPSLNAVPQTSSTAILSDFRNILVTTLTPINTRILELEQQLHATQTAQAGARPSPVNLASLAQEETGPSQQLQHDLEGGPQSSHSVFTAAQLAQDGIADAVEATACKFSDRESRTIGSWFSGVRAEHVRAILRNEFTPTDIHLQELRFAHQESPV
ncbi:hypothetical protein BJ508DRAFT_335555 [Ascobolus immersus RN42]|uniref:Uncharacterized protein n=1 Tax=Ascobolus immersus RN42 TaxID=1160509 RepID=A0A3N4HFM0_ASCIM|nr:hypothetical protein BJ508DRAFT_335555 [Ascobolus immersus RN42]